MHSAAARQSVRVPFLGLWVLIALKSNLRIIVWWWIKVVLEGHTLYLFLTLACCLLSIVALALLVVVE